MSEFKFVQWGKNVPVDYQRLNTMMINEQYLKDVADKAPRGVLAYAQTTSNTSLTAAGSYTDLSGLSSTSFSVEANRMVKITLTGFSLQTSSSPNAIYLALSIDGAAPTNDSQTIIRLTTTNAEHFPNVTYINNAFSVGTHTVKPQVWQYAATTLTVTGPIRLLVEDIGSAV